MALSGKHLRPQDNVNNLHEAFLRSVGRMPHRKQIGVRIAFAILIRSPATLGVRAVRQTMGTLRSKSTMHPPMTRIVAIGIPRTVTITNSLNRLASTSELHGGPWGQSGTDYQQTYDYDRYGNRTISQSQTSANVPHPNYTVDPNTNQLIAPAGYNYSYDAAGNQTNDTYTGQGQRTVNFQLYEGHS